MAGAGAAAAAAAVVPVAAAGKESESLKAMAAAPTRQMRPPLRPPGALAAGPGEKLELK